MEECIFGYVALLIECRFKRSSLPQSSFASLRSLNDMFMFVNLLVWLIHLNQLYFEITHYELRHWWHIKSPLKLKGIYILCSIITTSVPKLWILLSFNNLPESIPKSGPIKVPVNDNLSEIIQFRKFSDSFRKDKCGVASQLANMAFKRCFMDVEMTSKGWDRNNILVLV